MFGGMRTSMKSHCTSFPLDSSAIIHLAVRKKGYTNSFRLCAELSDTVCPRTLQAAADVVAPRFPTIVAGIQRGMFQYTVVPATEPPKVCLEQEYLADMPLDMIERCAIRILYYGNRIAVEIFHSLTDGYGGQVFFNALIAEYLCQKGLISTETANSIQRINPHDAEYTADDYLTYAETQTAPLNHRKVYRLPGKLNLHKPTRIVTGIYDTRELVETARYFGVSLTVFLTAVMAEAILEMRSHHADPKMSAQPLQIMIPVNLRKRFPSKTLRNFSLYALPCIMPIHQEMPFEKLIDSIVVQLKEQLSKNHLATMISTNVTLQKLPLFRFLPLSVKIRLLRIGFHFCGERNSCLSLSNLGEITYPPELRKYVHHIDFSLTPRRNAPYNCGIASFNGKLAISFSKKSDEKGLEWYFFHRLAELGYHSEMELENCS